MGTLERNRSGANQDFVALQFGGLIRQSDGTYKASIYGGTNISVRPGVVRIAENYANGFFACTGADASSVAEVALVTSNDLDGTTTDAGAAWSGAVTAFKNWLCCGNAIGSQVAAWGGFDVEDGFSGPSGARNLVNGYAASYTALYINTGDAGGCPSDHIPSSTDCGTATFPGWGPDDIYYVSWGAAPAWSSPEIYLEDGTQASQWYWLDRWAVANRSPMGFQGVTVQHDSCINNHGGCSGAANTVGEGYTQLYDALQQNSNTAQAPPWTTNFGWEQDHL